MTQLYKITNKLNNRYYIGVHTGDIFEDNYWGSGTAIRLAVAKYGKENFNREIIAEYENSDLAYWMEKCLVSENMIEDELCYNLTEGGYGGKLSSAVLDKISQKVKEYYKDNKHPWVDRKHTDDTKKKMKKNHADFTRGNHPKSKKLIHIETGKVFDCIKDAAEYENIAYTTLTTRLRKGYSKKFKYI